MNGDTPTGLIANSFLDELIGYGLLIPTGVPGVYGRSGEFEQLIDYLDAGITRLARNDGAEVMRFPPTLSRRTIESSGYVQCFPHLLGTVHCYHGDEWENLERIKGIDGHDGRWTKSQLACQVVLTPAACYPVYPAIAQRGRLPEKGRLVDVCSYCFRHEPSDDPTRMQAFRIREFVRLGLPADVKAFRNEWLSRGRQLLEALGLRCRVTVANDPFFGPAGEMLALMQRDEQLKFELQVPAGGAEEWTACISVNFHRDHFGKAFNLRTSTGERANTGCVGFGMERLALALIHQHGPDISVWSRHLKAVLESDAKPTPVVAQL